MPKVLFCGELQEGSRTHGGQKLQFKDTFKQNLKKCRISVEGWESSAADRP